MKISKEMNAARRQRIWDNLKEQFPGVSDFELLQAWLTSLGLSYRKERSFLYIAKEHFDHVPNVESIGINIQALDVVQNRSILSGDLNGNGYVFTESKIWKPSTILMMQFILETLLDGKRIS